MILMTVGPNPYFVFEGTSHTLSTDRTKSCSIFKEQAPPVAHLYRAKLSRPQLISKQVQHFFIHPETIPDGLWSSFQNHHRIPLNAMNVIILRKKQHLFRPLKGSRFVRHILAMQRHLQRHSRKRILTSFILPTTACHKPLYVFTPQRLADPARFVRKRTDLDIRAGSQKPFHAAVASPRTRKRPVCRQVQLQ